MREAGRKAEESHSKNKAKEKVSSKKRQWSTVVKQNKKWEINLDLVI